VESAANIVLMLAFIAMFVAMMRMHARGASEVQPVNVDASSRVEGHRGAPEVWIRVHEGYWPARVTVPAGVPVRLVFQREEDDTCSGRVLFPDYGIDATLTAFADTVVELPAGEPGERSFTCGEGRIRGTLVIEAPPGAAPSARHLAVPAALLSFFVPGAGHFLIRAWARGAIWLVGWLIVAAASGVAHGPAVLVLMVVSGADAYVFARSRPD